MIRHQHSQELSTLQSIFEGIDDAIFCHDLDMRITHWNPAAERLFGYGHEEIINESVYLLIPEERQQEKMEIMRDIMEGKRIGHFKTIRRTREGVEIPVSITISPIRDQEGQVIGSSQVARSIIEENTAEEKQARLAAIVASSDDAIVGKSLQGIITSWNIGAEKMFGYTEQEAIGQHISLLIPPERLDEEDIIIGNIRAGKKVDHFQTIRRTKGGQQLHISLTVSPILNKAGEIIGASKIARNITAQKEAERSIAKSMERMEILNSISKSINEDLDLQHILQKVTDATTRLTGADFGAFFYNQVDQAGESYWLYTISGAPRAAFENFPMPRNTAVFHPTFSGEGVVRVDDVTKDPRYGKNSPYFGMPEGHLPVVSYLAVPVITHSGVVIGGLFFGHQQAGIFKEEHEDLVVTVASQAAVAIDNSRLFEEVKDLSNKKDEFIALASHELKTPLTSMSGFLQILERTVPDGIAKSFAEKALKQLAKLNDLVNDLFDISKIQAGKLQLNFEPFDLSDLLDEIADTFGQTHAHYNLKMAADGELWVSGDKMRLEQVLTNLLGNAVKYAPDAREVSMIAIRTGNEVRISVKDQGPGILPENQQHIFSQFYRVKEQERKTSGLGLGLYISKDIIDRHGGRIWVESTPGHGATFTFSLPAFTN
ncbi:PAS domain S-box protein [Mucilaginibacter sp. SMC90]|uniref:PAS domain S-box protein n=1 Tax=Mucilaginibacter sp. SMC90 TaxID=2929803 RepID=UPI001FB4F10E|nr:PAS domain S-box protein [Mucilaginibacter sp. SMC90]UOE49180.1 PAS domain S-box protein [Mucilaginibacter sp. SMC90]